MAPDERGIEGFPLQLLLIFVIISLAVPLSWSFLESYSAKDAEAAVSAEFADLEAAVRDVYSMGPGNVRIVEFDVGASSFSGPVSVRLGGAPGDVWSNLSSCRYVISGRQEQYLMITDPGIAMVNMSSALELASGSRTISLRCAEEWTTGTDVDGDGILATRFIEIGVVD